MAELTEEFNTEKRKSRINSSIAVGGKMLTPAPTSPRSTRSPAEIKKPLEDILPEEIVPDRVGDWRNMRRIIAEDPEWSLATVPLLNELVIKQIVKNFESK